MKLVGELVDPRGEVVVSDEALAPRRGHTQGPLTIGFLVNEYNPSSGPDFTRYTEVLEQEFNHRLDVSAVVRQHKPVLSRPAGDEMLASFRACAGVVNGLAK
ncbi:MAG: hypothetical protein F4129_11690 [Acidimicrobiia bacterium]|nr:hypothetical protein [Acidimicrobiia bacterium]MYE73142.1 hypothetical protein [Acidimicrobiia bacterium]MYH97153.1 hypothetical protein [Acidimicrobiia bacterium]MYJ61796.1 hypothetical protein [Acidimicrobiia bacterium]MYL08924.1 hypothetical protein [Acidimicrobiia bacterium]